MQNHTDLKGGLITSTQKSEDDGKNRFTTDTLTFEDLANKSEYSGSGFGIGVSGSVKGNAPDNSHIMQVSNKTGVSHNGIGYASDSDSQSSVTKSGINTANIVITDIAKQQQITGKTAEETLKAVKTDITTDNYAEHSGSLKNNFDKDKVQSEIDLQVEVTKQAAPMIAQGVAFASDYLGKVKQYENKLLQKDLLEQAINQSNDPEEILRLNQALNEVDSYLTENKARYDLFKEGGLDRAGLHAVGGGVLTGDISGAVGAGVTSLSAPIIAQVADNSGSLKPVVDTVSGLAIGYTTGGTAGAFTGANADWNNRQLHPDERRWIKQNAEKFAEQQGISTEEATERLAQQAARQTDALWFLALSGGEDQVARDFLATANQTFSNESGKQQQFFTTQGKDFTMPQRYAPDARMDLDYYDKYLIKGDNNKINDRAKQIVADKAKSAADTLINDPKQAAKNTGKFAYNTGKAVVTGTVDCILHPINCAVGVKDGFVENATAIGTGAASMKENDLQRLYGQDTRTAQGFILAGNLTEAGLTATGAGKLGGATVKTAKKAVVEQAEKKAAQEAAENARKAKQAEINFGKDAEMVGQPEITTGSNSAGKANNPQSAATTQPVIGQGAVATRINVRNGDGSNSSGLNYAWKNHGNDSTRNKSKFTISKDEVIGILGDKNTVRTPAYFEPSSGNYIRNVDTGRTIGIDRYAQGGPALTTTLTVITDSKGNLVNTYPGRTKVR